MVTIVIPTRNRPDFLSRLLWYFSQHDVLFPIVVADSSDPPLAAEVRQVVGRFPALLIDFRSMDPALPVAEKILRTVANVSTPLLQLIGDDDFVVPGAMSRAASFLHEHPEYSMVVGDAFVFTVNGGTAFGDLLSAAAYPQREIDSPHALARVEAQFEDYSTTWYALHRTGPWRESFAATIKIDSTSHFIELTHAALGVASGRVKKIDELMLARQQITGKHYSVESIYEWPHKPEWSDQYAAFTVEVGRVVAERDGLSSDDARRLVQRAFAPYLQQFAGRHRLVASRWRAEGRRRWPNLVSLSERMARSLGHMSLAEMRDPMSRHHSAFLQIERAISLHKFKLPASVGASADLLPFERTQE